MAKRPGPKGKKSKNRMTSAEVEAQNAEPELQNQPIVGPNVQTTEFVDNSADAAVQDVMDQPFTEEAASADAAGGEGGDAAQQDGPSIPTEDREQTEGDLAKDGEEEKVPNSVVKDKFKTRYIENAKAAGETSKAAKRSNWDWLAQTLAEHCLGDKGKIDINKFVDILDANGVDHSRWTNRNKGWEGRFRMTGRVALQKIVAQNNLLKTTVSEIVPPTGWVERYKAK